MIFMLQHELDFTENLTMYIKLFKKLKVGILIVCGWVSKGARYFIVTSKEGFRH